MARLAPLAANDIPSDLVELMTAGEALMGFTPNDGLTLARRPAILKGVFALIQGVYGPGEVDAGLKRLIGEAASKAAGCVYCSAHAAYGAASRGVPVEKIEAVWRFEDSPLFDEAERAAINFAMAAAKTPSEATDADYARLAAYFDEGEIVEIIAVIALFGFLNRWNQAVATDLEAVPEALRARLVRDDPTR